MTYTLWIETAEGVKQDGFHLGTILPIAEQCALDALRRPGVMSVSLRQGAKDVVAIYDWRDLPETPVEDWIEE